MLSTPPFKHAPDGLLFLILFVAFPFITRSEQLPVKTYTTADGLVQNSVIRIVRDSRGFLWFCTEDGMSRFDGYAFINYDSSHGLPHPTITHLLEARDGSYWVATNGGGVARLNPYPERAGGQKTNIAGTNAPLFTAYQVGSDPSTNRVNILYQDRAGQIWAGTDGELFRLKHSDGRESFRKVDLGLPDGHRWVVVLSLAEDQEGRLWVGTWEGLFVRTPDGRVKHYEISPSQGFDYIRALLLDTEGRLWVGHMGAGVIVLDPSQLREADSAPPEDRGLFRALAPAIRRRFTKADGLTDDSIQSLCQSSDGHIWVGTSGGLSEYDGQRFRTYTKTEGVAVTPLMWLAEDVGGNIWGATAQGALEIRRSGFTTFNQMEGLAGTGVRSIFENQAGELYVVADDASVNLFDGQKFTAVSPNLPQKSALEWPQVVLQDHAGEWWFPTPDGLFRFPRVNRIDQLKHLPPKAVYTEGNGLPGRNCLHLFEDSRGDIWISVEGVKNNLVRWERSTEAFHIYTEADGIPDFLPPSCFVEDRSGSLWVGRTDGGLLRYREGRFHLFTTDDGIPAGQVQCLFLDHLGRLWVATNAGGVGRIDETAAERPQVTHLTMAEGLASNYVACITEDDSGRMYFGTMRGLNRLDPATGRITHYSVADGLIDGKIEAALRDHQGALWFGTPRGVSRLLPHMARPNLPPPVFITGLRVGGVRFPLFELGQAEVLGPELGRTENEIAIDFAGINFSFGDSLRYQYKLEGIDPGWSAPVAPRSVNFANLPPGAYRFLVRAVDASGEVSATAAGASFRILPPVWQRWWFLTLAALTMITTGCALYRYRVARLLEIANMRTRIATDLHDDIGANLTKIAILSEVARQQLGNGNAQSDSPLRSIARISRESVAAMSDIVWAINPQRDSLRDLVRRMRQHAEETCMAREIDLTFSAPVGEQGLKLSVDVRRDLYLIFKEAVNNAARHSECSRMEVALALERNWLSLEIKDNGSGFDPLSESEGNGLLNMRRRAERIGGKLEIDSSRGRGATVKLRLPDARSSRYSRPT